MLDCEGDPNADTANQPAEVDESQIAISGNQATFTWDITTYSYDGPSCDSCEANPNGRYPISNSVSTVPDAASASAYCS
jgi:hypothetical protein